MRRVALAITGTVAGLAALLSFKSHGNAVGTPAAISNTDAGGAAGASTSTSPPTSTPSGASGATSSSAASKAAGTKTITGSAVDTRYGPVQVRITVTNGKLTGVSAIDYPNQDPRDQEINATAIPLLNQEALSKGSAQIDMISGATYTSEGYIGSLQSALNSAGL